MTWTTDDCIKHLSDFVDVYKYLSEYIDADRLLDDGESGASIASMFAFGTTVMSLRQIVCASYAPEPAVGSLVRQHSGDLVDSVEATILRLDEVATELRGRGAIGLAKEADGTADSLAFWLGAFVQARQGDIMRGQKIASRGILYEYSIGDEVDPRDVALLDAFNRLYMDKSPSADDVSYLVELHIDEAYTALAWDDYPAAVSRAALAGRLAPGRVEPYFIHLDALSREYLADNREPTADEIQKLEGLHHELLAHCPESNALATFIQTHGRHPKWLAVAILSRAYIRAGHLVEARRLLRDAIQAVGVSQQSNESGEELRVLLSQVNDALAQQVERSTRHMVGLDDLPPKFREEFLATFRRLEVITQVSAREVSLEGFAELVNNLSEQIGRQGVIFPSRHADTQRRLAAEFGQLWDKLTGSARTLLLSGETLYAEMAPHQSGEPAILAHSYTASVEALLRTSLRVGSARVMFGQLIEILGRLSSPATFVPTTPAEQRIQAALSEPAMQPWQDFWTRDLPSALRHSDLNIVDVRNRAAHGDQVSWDELRRLHEILLGADEDPGLIRRVLQARPG